VSINQPSRRAGILRRDSLAARVISENDAAGIEVTKTGATMSQELRTPDPKTSHSTRHEASPPNAGQIWRGRTRSAIGFCAVRIGFEFSRCHGPGASGDNGRCSPAVHADQASASRSAPASRARRIGRILTASVLTDTGTMPVDGAGSDRSSSGAESTNERKNR
jgi:hypothetical protein